MSGITVAQFDKTAQTVFILAVQTAVPAILTYGGTVTITSVASATVASVAAAALRASRLLSGSGIQVAYSIAYSAPASASSAVYNTLSTSIAQATTASPGGSSAFAAALYQISVSQNVTALQAVTVLPATMSAPVQVSGPSDGPSSSSPKPPLSAIIGGAVGGGIALILITTAVGFFIYTRQKRLATIQDAGDDDIEMKSRSNQNFVGGEYTPDGNANGGRGPTPGTPAVATEAQQDLGDDDETALGRDVAIKGMQKAPVRTSSPGALVTRKPSDGFAAPSYTIVGKNNNLAMGDYDELAVVVREPVAVEESARLA